MRSHKLEKGALAHRAGQARPREVDAVELWREERRKGCGSEVT